MNGQYLGTNESVCIGCGCTDSFACEGGCYWVDVDRTAGRGLCSTCDERSRQPAPRRDTWARRMIDGLIGRKARA